MSKSVKQMVLEVKHLIAKEEERVTKEFLNKVESTYKLYIRSKA